MEIKGGTKFAPAVAYQDVELPSAPPISPDGGIAPGHGVAPPPALPPATPENFICLRGPCRHHVHLQTVADYGNPAGTFKKGEEPRQHTYLCVAFPGLEIDLTEDCCFDCNRWSPLMREEIEARQRGLDTFYEQHPELRSSEDSDDSGT